MCLRSLIPIVVLVGFAGVLTCLHDSHAIEPPLTPLLRIETGMHTAPIRRITVDIAGHYLVTGSDDKTARVWELATGRLLQILRPPQGEGLEGKVYAVALSPDGATVAVAGWTGWEWDRAYSIYLFDRVDGRLIGRLTGLPSLITHLSFSADGRYLSAALEGIQGVRVFRSGIWKQIMADSNYGDSCYSVDFDRTGRLVTASFDGYVRLYDAGFRLMAKKSALSGKQPYAARFSPDGRLVAVGFTDSAAVDVISGTDLSLLFSPDTKGIDNGNMSCVTWSQDGRFLYAGGLFWDRSVWRPIMRWSEAGRGAAKRLRASGATDVITDLCSLSAGRLVFGSRDPAFGVLDAGGNPLLNRRGEIPDFRGNEDRLLLSADGAVVEFGFFTRTSAGEGSSRRALFDLTKGQLNLDPPELAGLQAPRVEGEPAQNWKNTLNPRVLGLELAIRKFEVPRSLAFAADGQRFVLGTEWSLRFYDRSGRELMEVSMPGAVWAVNLSADGRYAVAALGDGTVRWYRTIDGGIGDVHHFITFPIRSSIVARVTKLEIIIGCTCPIFPNSLTAHA